MLDVLNLKQLTGIQTIIAPTNSAFVATQKSTGLPLLEFINQQNNNKPIVEKEWLQIMQQHLIQQKIEVVSGLQYETVQGGQLEIKINNQKEVFIQQKSCMLEGERKNNCSLQVGGNVIAGSVLDSALLLVIDQVMYFSSFELFREP
eukprot:EC095368.1.p1 GENE.EC095368.1~~EC095368.1.p1  ORF type:complete len:147 (+),score=12.20 EC095368.1:2-442(+)